jgi:hypothetical protein
MVDTSDQLAFWSPSRGEAVSDDWPVLRSSVWPDPVYTDDIVVSEETFSNSRNPVRDIVLFVGSPNRAQDRSRSNEILTNAAPATIAALIRIAFAQRETLSLDRLSVRERAVKRLIARDVELGRTRIQAGSLANSYMRISHEVFRYDLDSAWMRALARTPHHRDDARDFPKIERKSDRFIPSAALIDIVRDGLRSHSENYPRLVEPRFVDTGLALLRDEDISIFIAIRMWRLMLSLADHATAEGKEELQLGNKTGFLDKVDHLILDRIPVSPKNVTPFLEVLYEEYSQFAGRGLVLPGRGKLWSNEGGLFFKPEKTTLVSVQDDDVSDRKTEVFFE